jgi:hypothetical protein
MSWGEMTVTAPAGSDSGSVFVKAISGEQKSARRGKQKPKMR